jgi:hypothetical protein
MRRFVRSTAVEANCDLCGKALASGHSHLFESSTRLLVCACETCVDRVRSAEASRYRVVPRAARRLEPFRLTDAMWTALRVPVDLLVVFVDGAGRAAEAMHPGPAGIVDALVPHSGWSALVHANPVLTSLSPGVEGLVIYRVPIARGLDPICLAVPIDRCYALLHVFRGAWRGLSGGSELWQEVDRFIAGLQADPRARPAP